MQPKRHYGGTGDEEFIIPSNEEDRLRELLLMTDEYHAAKTMCQHDQDESVLDKSDENQNIESEETRISEFVKLLSDWMRKMHDIDTQLINDAIHLLLKFIQRQGKNVSSPLAYECVHVCLNLFSVENRYHRFFSIESLESCIQYCQQALNHTIKSRNQTDESENHSFKASTEYILKKITSFIEIIERIFQQHEKEIGEQQVLAAAVNLCVSAYKILETNRDISRLQHNARNLLQLIFLETPTLRPLVLSEVTDAICDMPGCDLTIHQFQKLFAQKRSASDASVLSLTLLDLFQCSVVKHSDIEMCNQMIREFILSLLKKYSAEKAQENVRIYENFLQLFVEDLLLVLHEAVWPAAALVLHQLANILSTKLVTSAMQNAKLGKSSRIYLLVLGKILARSKMDIDWANSNQLTVPQRWNGDAPCKICQKSVERSKNVVSCTKCEAKFHERCIGLRDIEVLECDDCVVLQQMEDHHSVSGCGGEANANDFRKICLGFLGSELLHENASAKSAFNFTMALWEGDEKTNANGSDDESSYIKLTRQRLENEQLSMIAELKSGKIRHISRSTASAIRRYLASKCSYGIASEEFAERLTMSFLAIFGAGQQSTFRKNAIRALGIVVDVFPQLVCDKRIKTSLEQRILDENASVREAALDVLGKYVIFDESLASDYQELITTRIEDQALLVRKRAVKIATNLLAQFPDLAFRSLLLEKLMHRLEDPDEDSALRETIVQLIKGLLVHGCVQSSLLKDLETDELWIPTSRNTSNNSHTRSSCRSSIGSGSNHDFVERSAELFMELVELAADPFDLLDILSDIPERVEALCQATLQRLLCELDMAPSSESSNRLRHYFQSLHLLHTAHPTQETVVVMVPYLKPNALSVCDKVTVREVKRIILTMLETIPMLPKKLEDDLTLTLKQFVFREPPSIMLAAIKVLGRNEVHCAALHEIGCRFEQCLRNHQQLVVSDHLERAVLGLGAIIREQDDPETLSSRWSLIESFCYNDNEGIRMRTVESLCMCLYVDASYALKATDHFERILKRRSGESAKVRVALMNAIRELVLFYHNQEQADEANRDSTLTILGDQTNQNVSMIIGVFQSIAPVLIENLYYPEQEVRLSAVSIYALALKKGLVNPLNCVEPMIALECEANWDIHDTAHHFLVDLDSKYPNIISMKAVSGIFRAFQLHDGVDSVRFSGIAPPGHFTAGALRPSYSLLSRVYSKCIGASIKSRHSFLRSVLNTMQGEEIFTHDDSNSLRKLQFLSEMCASLPFAYQDEVLFLVSSIDRWVLLCDQKSFRVVKEWLESNGNPDNDVRRHCMNVQRIGLLIRLAEYLVDTYRIHDTQLETYSPSMAKTSEKLGIAFDSSLPCFQGIDEDTLSLFDTVPIDEALRAQYRNSFRACESLFHGYVVEDAEMLPDHENKQTTIKRSSVVPNCIGDSDTAIKSSGRIVSRPFTRKRTRATKCSQPKRKRKTTRKRKTDDSSDEESVCLYDSSSDENETTHVVPSESPLQVRRTSRIRKPTTKAHQVSDWEDEDNSE